jgi:transposase, IS30 family
MRKSTIETKKAYRHLVIEEREELAIGLNQQKSIIEISKELGRHRSTIYREKHRNNATQNTVKYRANRAQLRSDERKGESHKRTRLKNKVIQEYVEKHLVEDWTPELISGRLSMEIVGQKTNYESIYLWIYKERFDLIQHLPRAHRKRRKRGSAKNKRNVKVPNRTMITERPNEIAARVEPGHWEADTAVSRQSKGAISVTSERVSRFLISKKLDAKTAENMDIAITESLNRLPRNLCKSITYDNGTENANHVQTNIKLGTKSYFCNPYHSWEKGSIENRIGMIRRYFPKKTNWALISQEQLDKIVIKINTRPMKCLGYRTPEEVFVALAL